MSENAITRRRFLVGSAGAAALVAGAGSLGFAAWNAAGAEEADEPKEAVTAHSLCGACPAQCGFTAYTIDGTLSNLIGDEGNPQAQGKLCARGYAYSQIAYAENRLTDPLKKNENNEFEIISWEDAYSEIAEKLTTIIGTYGPESFAAIQEGGSSSAYYAKRLVNALGSENYFTRQASGEGYCQSAINQVIGARKYVSDIERSNMVLIMGFNQAEAFRPATIANLEKAYESGTQIVLADPRYSSAGVFTSEWLPIMPGSELALLLAMARVLITEELYDAEFVNENTVGLEEWASALSSYTPEWAEVQTGLSGTDIARIARNLAQAAPASSVEVNFGTAAAGAYLNSGEMVRAACLVNTLLGCWNQPGGALVVPDLSFETTESLLGKSINVNAVPLGATEFPLAVEGVGPYLIQAAEEGTLKSALFCGSNMLIESPDPTYAQSAFSKLELKVAIDTTLTETAALADYVLPDTSYLERLELPVIQGVANPVVALRDQAVEKVYENTRPIDQIITELAQACGKSEYFAYTVEELAEEQLTSFGLSLNELRVLGSTAIAGAALEFGTEPAWETPTGKIQFTSEEASGAGLSAVPVWVEPAVQVVGNTLRLITDEQPVHFATRTTTTEGLVRISEDYELASAWINAQRAEELGIADGDEIEIEAQGNIAHVKVKLTQRINPLALYLPRHYRFTSQNESSGGEETLSYADFIPLQFEPGYGSPMIQEALVSVKKVGA